MGKLTFYLIFIIIFFSKAHLYSVAITDEIAPGIKLSYLKLISYVNFTTLIETQIDWRYLPEDEHCLKELLVRHLELIEEKEEGREYQILKVILKSTESFRPEDTKTNDLITHETILREVESILEELLLIEESTGYSGRSSADSYNLSWSSSMSVASQVSPAMESFSFPAAFAEEDYEDVYPGWFELNPELAGRRSTTPTGEAAPAPFAASDSSDSDDDETTDDDVSDSDSESLSSGSETISTASDEDSG
jgi:hypothetical protein